MINININKVWFVCMYVLFLTSKNSQEDSLFAVISS